MTEKADSLDMLKHKLHLCLIGKYSGDPEQNAIVTLLEFHTRHMQAALTKELDGVLQAGAHFTTTTKNGNDALWYPDGLWKYLHHRKDELLSETKEHL